MAKKKADPKKVMGKMEQARLARAAKKELKRKHNK